MKSSDVVILGNGKSVELYDATMYHEDTTVIGCNVPPEGIKLDFVCAVDAYAVSHAYRCNAPYHRRLQEGWKLVLGPRACGGLKGVKHVPGGKETLFDGLKREGHVHRKMDLFKDVLTIGQRYFSTGHLAFMFACDEYPNANIHFYGFDSFFTGSSVSHSLELLRNGKPLDKRGSRGASIEKPDPTVDSWFWLWQRVFESDLNTSRTINIHGYEGDCALDHIYENIVVHRHEKVKNEELQEN